MASGDVYKRQKYVTPLCRHPLAYDPELLMKGLALLYQLNAPQAVSYTHLDVYKRQFSYQLNSFVNFRFVELSRVYHTLQ